MPFSASPSRAPQEEPTTPHTSTRPSHPDDEGITLEALRSGDPAAVQAVTRWISVITENRLWTSRIEESDVMQETILRLLVTGADHVRSLPSFARSIAVHVIVDEARRERVARTYEASLDPDPPGDPDPEQILISREERMEEARVVLRVLGNLKPRCRKLLGMVFVDRMPYRAIAKTLGTTEGAVKTRVSRCYDEVADTRRRLGRNLSPPETTTPGRGNRPSLNTQAGMRRN
ncbi:MAG: sigma-70 family RNA polymerase sigma factor [Bacteroidota bacterium]